MIMVSAGNFQQGGVRMGQGNASTLTPDDALGDPRRARRAVRRAPASTRAARSSPATMNWNTQVQGTDVDLPLIRSWPTTHGRVLQRRWTSRPRRRSPCSARVVHEQLFGADVDPVGADHPHQQPAVHGRRRDGEQGPVGHGPGPGRHGLRAVHDGDEEAARHHLHPEHHGVGGLGGGHDADGRAHRDAAARRGTRSSPGEPTTSWCARWRKWRASACRRRRR